MRSLPEFSSPTPFPGHRIRLSSSSPEVITYYRQPSLLASSYFTEPTRTLNDGLDEMEVEELLGLPEAPAKDDDSDEAERMEVERMLLPVKASGIDAIGWDALKNCKAKHVFRRIPSKSLPIGSSVQAFAISDVLNLAQASTIRSDFSTLVPDGVYGGKRFIAYEKKDPVS
ncbi:hypothetical protein FRC03_003993 [Tulasnella sp. 419]|nr:hypothetical protein FRC03_003993 [Tulasnella sp. 419]